MSQDIEHKHTKAIVTMAIGQKYLTTWKKVCEPNWRKYAAVHGYDLICIDKPLDDSERARARHPSWQKCLILSQEFANHYERIVWVDADILINTNSAPCVSEGVPLDKVGVVEVWSEPYPEWYQECLRRMYEFWGFRAIINYNAHEYYTKYGWPSSFDKVAQNGVMVLSPLHHRQLLERNYYDYEDRGSEWNAEMRPFSYELLKANAVHWIDCRFNVNWFEHRFMHYPFLTNPQLGGKYTDIKERIAAFLGLSSLIRCRKACVNAAFLNSFFLHFGGGLWEDMKLVDSEATSWKDCRL